MGPTPRRSFASAGQVIVSKWLSYRSQNEGGEALSEILSTSVSAPGYPPSPGGVSMAQGDGGHIDGVAERRLPATPTGWATTHPASEYSTMAALR
jgi:hypothetical protein